MPTPSLFHIFILSCRHLIFFLFFVILYAFFINLLFPLFLKYFYLTLNFPSIYTNIFVLFQLICLFFSNNSIILKMLFFVPFLFIKCFFYYIVSFCCQKNAKKQSISNLTYSVPVVILMLYRLHRPCLSGAICRFYNTLNLYCFGSRNL